MTLPLFNLFELPQRTELADELRGLGPGRAWRLMRALFDVDLPRYERESPEHERAQAIEALAAEHLRLAPALSRCEVTTAARRFATYGPRLQLESTFITLWLRDRATLFDQVVDVAGAGHLDAARRSGNGVLVAPLHLGPAYVIPPLLAFTAPTRLVFNRMNFAELRAAAFPDLDVDAVAIDEGNTFATGLRTLRAGGLFAMFPELDPRGQSVRHRPVPFLGTTIAAPEGPVLLAQAARAPIVSAVIDGHGDGRFTLRFDTPIHVGRGSGASEDGLLALWGAIERHVRTRLGDWEMWIEFDRMIHPGTS